MPTALERQRAASCRSQTGVGLLELLIAVLILSFGILGITAMQARALSYSQLSTYRSQATALTDDMLDRMRLDRAKVRHGDWSSTLNQTSASYAAPTSLAERELGDWKSRVHDLLPNGAASITTVTATSTDEPVHITIQIQWAERDSTVSSWTTEALL